MNWKAGLAVGCLLAVLGAAVVHLGRQSAAWEHRATRAEQFVQQDGVVVARLRDSLARTVRTAYKRDTTFIIAQGRIAHADSVSHPDSTCTLSIVARDSALAAARQDVGGWFAAYLDEGLVADHLQTENDSLTSVLKARPSVVLAPFFEAKHPALHVSVQAMLWPQQRIGIGVSYDIFRIP